MARAASVVMNLILQTFLACSLERHIKIDGYPGPQSDRKSLRNLVQKQCHQQTSFFWSFHLRLHCNATILILQFGNTISSNATIFSGWYACIHQFIFDLPCGSIIPSFPTVIGRIFFQLVLSHVHEDIRHLPFTTHQNSTGNTVRHLRIIQNVPSSLLYSRCHWQTNGSPGSGILSLVSISGIQIQKDINCNLSLGQCSL